MSIARSMGRLIKQADAAILPRVVTLTSELREYRLSRLACSVEECWSKRSPMAEPLLSTIRRGVISSRRGRSGEHKSDNPRVKPARQTVKAALPPVSAGWLPNRANHECVASIVAHVPESVQQGCRKQGIERNQRRTRSVRPLHHVPAA